MKKLIIVLVLLLSTLLMSCTANTPYIGENGNWWVGDEDLGVAAQGPQGVSGEKGEKGEDGVPGESVSVTSVKKTNTTGSIDTYTIYFSDGSSTTFTVTNGTDGQTITIASVDKINTNGLVDTYKVTFSDSSSHTFTVKNGEDGTSVTVASIGKTNSVGLIDTYEIVFSDGTKSTFSVTNGRDGNTPYIGTNGNWWIGDEDTGVSATIENMDRIGTDGLVFRMTIRGGVAGYEVSSYIGSETDIVIPNYIFDKPVVSIAQDALPTQITSVSISSNTEWLPEFEGYTNLVSFDFNSAPVDTTAVEMFDGCYNLETVENYENIRTISSYTFCGTKVVDFDFSNILAIGSYAFYDRELDYDDWAHSSPKLFVYIPSNVTSIGAYAFDSEIAVYYAGSTCEYSNGLLYKNVKHTEDGYYYIDNGTTISVVNYDGTSSKITIPRTIDGKAVTAIANYAFYVNPYIERVEIPNSVISIGEGTFYLCKKLYGVFVPDSVESCGEFEGLTEEQEDGFENTTVFFEATTFDYPGGVTSPADLDLVKYMTGIKPSDIVDDDACVYLKKTLSYEVVTIKNKAGVVTIPATVNSLPVSRINTYALYKNTLTKIVHISDGIDKISTQAFYSSSNLLIVNIPNSVDAVNYRGFYSLSNCVIYIEADEIPTDWDSSWYYSIDEYQLNSQADFSSDGSYLYEMVDNKLYITKYLKTISTKTPIIIPEKIDGKTVYGVRSNAFRCEASNSSSNRYIFVIPSTITVMESNAIYISSYYGYSDLYLNFANSTDIPSTWNSDWFYSYYGYRYNSSYNNVYFKGQWSLVNNIPTPTV